MPQRAVIKVADPELRFCISVSTAWPSQPDGSHYDLRLVQHTSMLIGRRKQQQAPLEQLAAAVTKIPSQIAVTIGQPSGAVS